MVDFWGIKVRIFASQYFTAVVYFVANSYCFIILIITQNFLKWYLSIFAQDTDFSTRSYLFKFRCRDTNVFYVTFIITSVMLLTLFCGLHSYNQQSITKIMEKAAIWTISCFYSLPPFNSVESQWAKLASSYIMGLQHFVLGEVRFLNTLF